MDKDLSVVGAHRGSDFVEGLLGDEVRTLVSGTQDVGDMVGVLGEVVSALPVRGEEVVHERGGELFESACAGVADLVGEVILVAT